MNSLFLHRERRLAFVVISLAGWFGILGLFGQYFPANATTSTRQLTVNLHGNQLTGHWAKKDGRWHFQKISKISRIQRSKSRSVASLKTPKMNAKAHLKEPIMDPAAPKTTASLNPSMKRKTRKKQLRAKLADEIGVWAKIGNRWEWQVVGKGSRQVEIQPEPETLTQSSAPHVQQRQNQQSGPHWILRDGIWSIDVVYEQNIIRNI